MTGDITGPGLTETPRTALDKTMSLAPRALASKAHIIFLGGLLVYLVLLPLARVYTPSPSAMLIGGNWCNVTSDIGACIAAGGTVALLRHSRRRNRIAEATHRITADLYRFHAGRPHPDAPQSPGGPRDPHL